MNRIDWVWLAITLLWTGGLGLAVSIFGLARYQGGQVGEPLKVILIRPGYRLALIISSALFLVGVLFSAATLGLKIIIGMAVTWLVVELALYKP